jgi:hypothetical protein
MMRRCDSGDVETDWGMKTMLLQLSLAEGYFFLLYETLACAISFFLLFTMFTSV